MSAPVDDSIWWIGDEAYYIYFISLIFLNLIFKLQPMKRMPFSMKIVTNLYQILSTSSQKNIYEMDFKTFAK